MGTVRQAECAACGSGFSFTVKLGGGNAKYCSPECVRHGQAEFRRYGLTLHESRNLLARGSCDICSRKIKTRKAACIDHDHETGKVRGLLDGRCNTLLALAEDSPGRLFEAQVYLARSTFDLRDLCQSA